MNIIMCTFILLWFWLLQYELCLLKLRNNGKIFHPYIVLLCQLWVFTYIFNCVFKISFKLYFIQVGNFLKTICPGSDGPWRESWEEGGGGSSRTSRTSSPLPVEKHFGGMGCFSSKHTFIRISVTIFCEVHSNISLPKKNSEEPATRNVFLYSVWIKMYLI